jgi:hypothetical protein
MLTIQAREVIDQRKGEGLDEQLQKTVVCLSTEQYHIACIPDITIAYS